LDARFRPVAAVWTRQPVTGEEDIKGNAVPNPRAIQVDDGWRLARRALRAGSCSRGGCGQLTRKALPSKRESLLERRPSLPAIRTDFEDDR
jgi:hypothetical protein